MIKYGIVGCGMMGREHIRNINLIDHTSIEGIFDPSKQMCFEALKLAPKAVCYDSIDKLLRNSDIDCFVIASPNFCHVDNLIEVGNLTRKPILIEKPVATSLSDLRKLNEFCCQYEAPIWVAMEYRYMPALAEFIKIAKIDTGGIKMLTIREHRFPFLPKENNWNRFNEFSGGTFVEKCCHFFDLMRFIGGENPVQIMASGGQVCNHLDEFYDGKKSDIWDCGYVIVDFEGGSRAMLELCMFADSSIYQEELTAMGPNGKVECFLPGPKRFWNSSVGKQPLSKIITSDRLTQKSKSKEIAVDEILINSGDHNGSTFYQHERFNKVVRGMGQIEISVDDGIWAVRMGLAAQLSSVEGRVVKVSEFV